MPSITAAIVAYPQISTRRRFFRRAKTARSASSAEKNQPHQIGSTKFAKLFTGASAYPSADQTQNGARALTASLQCNIREGASGWRIRRSL